MKWVEAHLIPPPCSRALAMEKEAQDFLGPVSTVPVTEKKKKNTCRAWMTGTHYHELCISTSACLV